jgi:hypothetical protein
LLELAGDDFNSDARQRFCAGLVEHAARILDECIISKKTEEKID